MIFRPVTPQSAEGRLEQNCRSGLMAKRISGWNQVPNILGASISRTYIAMLVVCGIGAMLSGNQNIRHAHGFVLFIENGDLGFGIGANPRISARLAVLRESPGQAMREDDRERHQLRRFHGCIAKHDALIASTLFSARTLVRIHSLSDIGRLLGDDLQNFDLVRMKCAELSVYPISRIACRVTST